MDINIKSYYCLPEKNNWQGRQDSDMSERFFQVVALKAFTDFLATPITKPTCVILGFACDEGVRRNQGRIGAKLGPKALRLALANIPLHGQVENLAILDVGDILCIDEDLENAQKHLSLTVQQIISKKCIPIVLGGGHETAWGHYSGLASNADSSFAIINFDAHFDMRSLKDNKGTSGTSFLQIAKDRQRKKLPFHYYCIGIQASSNTNMLYQTAEQWGVDYLTCDDIYAHSQELNRFIKKIIAHHDTFYVSVCLDVFAASDAPGVSASSPYGLQPWHVLTALQQLSASGKIIALDVVELAPNLDRDNLTAKLGGLCIAQSLYHWHVSKGGDDDIGYLA